MSAEVVAMAPHTPADRASAHAQMDAYQGTPRRQHAPSTSASAPFMKKYVSPRSGPATAQRSSVVTATHRAAAPAFHRRHMSTTGSG